MTPDEQDALSHKYHAWMIVPLSSGLFCLFNSSREVICIGTIEGIHSELNKWEIPIITVQSRVTELSLEELDLG